MRTMRRTRKRIIMMRGLYQYDEEDRDDERIRMLMRRVI